MGDQEGLISLSLEDKHELLEQLDLLEENLVQFEKKQDNLFEANIKRIFHNLKGTFQMLGFFNCGEVVHQIEELFDHHNKDPNFVSFILNFKSNLEKNIDQEEDRQYISQYPSKFRNI